MNTGSRWAAACAGVGVVAGALYTIAPIVLLSLGGMVVLVAAAGRGLPHDRRRLLQVALATALVARVLVLGLIAAAGVVRHADPAVGIVLSGDEGYALERSLRTRDIAFGVPVTKYDYVVAFDQYGRTPYVSMLTALQLWFGPSPYGPRVLNSFVFGLAATILFGVMRRSLGWRPAFVGLLVTLWYPALFVWSVSALKESVYLLGGALVFAGTIGLVRAGGWRGRLRAGLAIAAGLVIVAPMRPGAVVLAVGGIAIGFALRAATRSARSAALAVAVVAAVLVAVAVSPRIQGRALAALGSTAKTQTGHVFTVGHSYQTLDYWFYISPAAPASSRLTLKPDEAARYVMRSVVSFIAVPVPWQFVSVHELAYIPDQLLWYVLIVLFPVGVAAAWRRDPLVACLLVGYVLPTALAVALTNGNIGTLVRLRGIVVPYLSQLSAVGMIAVLEQLAEATSAAAPVSCDPGVPR